jgi:hypothetical protein
MIEGQGKSPATPADPGEVQANRAPAALGEARRTTVMRTGDDPIMNALSLMMLALAASDSPSTPPLEDILARTAVSVERFWDQFSAVNCTEAVTQEKIGDKGKIIYRRESLFDYLILMSLQGDDLNVEESRILQNEAGKPSNLPLLLTSGFSTLMLIFHPYYQGSFEFQRLEDDVTGPRRLRLYFRHVPGTRTTSALRLRDKDYPLDLEGIAWIVPDTWTVKQIEAHLESPLDDLNLRSLRTVVKYGPQYFQSGGGSQWLPEEASIDVETARQRWRNVHTFKDYRRFSVRSESVIAK